MSLASLLTAAALAVTAATASASPARPPGPAAMHCTSYKNIPVALAQGGPESYHMYGELCYRGTSLPRTVQLLVHGATYNHLHWEMPVKDGTADLYNYPEVATAAGYATFNVDRIGNGASSHPADSADVTVEAGAVALHSIITKLRSGWFAHHRFQKIIWVGHSYGSYEAWSDLAMYHNDVDGAIITGALHRINSATVAEITGGVYPAKDDPNPALQSLHLQDDGYLTTLPPDQNGGASVREQAFYDPDTTDPNVVATDEAHKDLMTVAQINWLLPTYSLPPDQWPTQQMTMPVLTVVGQEDGIFCSEGAVDCSSDASVQQFESQFYPPQAHLQAKVIPNTGHDIQLHKTVPQFYAAALTWALSHVAP